MRRLEVKECLTAASVLYVGASLAGTVGGRNADARSAACSGTRAVECSTLYQLVRVVSVMGIDDVGDKEDGNRKYCGRMHDGCLILEDCFSTYLFKVFAVLQTA